MDLSRVSDELLDRAIAQLDAGQPTGIPPEEQAALRAEWSRRRSGAPDNVAANLDAAATPITPDPAVKPRQIAPPAATSPGDLRTRMIEAGYTPAEADVAVRQESTMPNANLWPPSEATLREGAAYVRGQDRKNASLDNALAEAMGHNYQPVDVTGPDTVMVDGVAVPAYRLSDGQPFGGMYRLGDLRRAQEAADEQRLSKMFSESAQQDLENYGTRQLYRYRRNGDGDLIPGRGVQIPTTGDLEDRKAEDQKYAALTPQEQAQQDRLAKRRDMEYRQTDQNAMLRNRPGMRDLNERREKARNLRSDMARLAGGSQNLNSGNNAFFQALAMLEGVQPGAMDAQQQAMVQMMPMNQVRGMVEAQNMANAGDVIKRFYTSGAAGALMDPAMREMQMMQAREQMRQNDPHRAGAGDLASGDPHTPAANMTLDSLAEQHDTGGLGTMSWDDENALAITLRTKYGMTQPEAEAAAHRAAEKRRWYLWNARGYSNPSTGGAAPGVDPGPK